MMLKYSEFTGRIYLEVIAMKKIKAVFCIILSLTAVVSLFSSCGEHGRKIMNDVYSQYDNLADSIEVTDMDGKTASSFSLKGKQEETRYVTVDLLEQKDFNTVVLKESGKNVTLFEIYASNDKDKDYKFLYQSDCIEGGHTCFLGDISYRYLRIFVNQSSGGYNLNGLGVYNIKKENAGELRVNTYLVAENISEDMDASMLECVTDIIVFGTAKFTAQGGICFVDGSGESVDEKYYADKINILKEKTAGKNINLICDIAMPYGNDNADIISMLSEEYVDATVENIRAFVEKYGFDGYDMDYEFPNSKTEWKQYNEFLRRLDKAIPDKIISLAIAPWDLRFDDDVLEIIDRAEVMLYDMFTAHGYHSIFAVTANGVKKAIDGGFDKSKIDLGVPFYSRPTNKLGYWGDYKQFESSLDRFTNLIYFNDFDHSGSPMTAPQYINSVQMIADKTAFAVDAGLGGIMIWHMSCDLPYDNELSLFRAIYETKQAKK